MTRVYQVDLGLQLRHSFRLEIEVVPCAAQLLAHLLDQDAQSTVRSPLAGQLRLENRYACGHYLVSLSPSELGRPRIHRVRRRISRLSLALV